MAGNKVRRKTVFNMADGILSHCNVTPGSEIMSLNSLGGSSGKVLRGSGMTCH